MIMRLVERVSICLIVWLLDGNFKRSVYKLCTPVGGEYHKRRSRSIILYEEIYWLTRRGYILRGLNVNHTRRGLWLISLQVACSLSHRSTAGSWILTTLNYANITLQPRSIRLRRFNPQTDSSVTILFFAFFRPCFFARSEHVSLVLWILQTIRDDET